MLRCGIAEELALAFGGQQAKPGQPPKHAMRPSRYVLGPKYMAQKSRGGRHAARVPDPVHGTYERQW